MDKNILKAVVGNSKRVLEVVDVKITEVDLPGKRGVKKALLTCKSLEGLEFTIDEVLIRDSVSGALTVKGLWVTLDKQGNLGAGSMLAKTLKYHNASSIEDMIGKEIIAFPNKRNFLVIVACEFDEEEIPW